MAKTVTVVVPREGISLGKRSISVKSEGYVGESCKNATAAIERALGMVTEDKPTEELYATEQGVEHLNQG